MPILRSLLVQAARRLASDEQVQQKAAELYRDEVRPRAETAWNAAKPRIEKTRTDIGDIAKETDPRRQPARFAGRATRRILTELKRKPDRS